MSETWANGLDLDLDVSGSRVRQRLEAGLRAAIRSGRLAEGARLPSSRALAVDLGIARNTVAEVYAQLTAEGWLTARSGSGTTVAPRSGPASVPDQEAAATAAHPRYDLWPGEPDLSAFPRGEWLTAARKALADAPDAVFGYGDPRGLPALRGALAEYLARARGVVTMPGGDNIVICSGFAHGLEVICRALRAAGAGTVAVEEYGHPGHHAIIARQGLRTRLLPLDARGAVIGAAGDADAVLLTPAHQFPLGMTLAPDRRRSFAEWGGTVIEDDYDGEFRYDRQPVGAMQALAPDRVIYCGTASKSLAPGVRLAWLVIPPSLLDGVTAALSAGPSALDQLTLAEFVTSGAYDRQIRRARLVYRHRRDRLISALDPLGLRVGGIAAGLHVVVDLPALAAERRAVARAEERGLALSGLGWYAFAASSASGADDAGVPTRAGLVIGYARPPEHAYTTAIARLCAVLTP
ncbi:MAG TPA: PLP-dependent aminotransferase family protein [Trebonia sp.]|nr:PLP-dependent aminotransferase family protein [Trebonia sp.]